MRRAWPWLALALGVAVIVVFTGRDDSGVPLDPRSTGPLGARGLVLLLREMGVTAEIGPAADGDVAVVLVDDLGSSQHRQLSAWVNRGGTLVVADPLSDFSPALAGGGAALFEEQDTSELRNDCELPAIAGVRAIDVAGAAMLRVRKGAIGCFSRGGGAYLVAREEGRGTVVALGGAALFTNERITHADNAVLAVSLLAPVPGSKVTVLETGAPGSGDQSLSSLLPGGVRRGLWQLVVAFVAVVIWRARRMGRPIEERQPVDIAGSELVIATGNLLQQSGRRAAAAAMLRLQLRRHLAARLGIPLEHSDEQVAQTLIARGADPARVAAAFGSSRPIDDRELAAQAAAIESLRRTETEVTHV